MVGLFDTVVPLFVCSDRSVNTTRDTNSYHFLPASNNIVLTSTFRDTGTKA